MDIKECVVVKKNGCVAVVKYGDTYVQIPSKNVSGDTVFIAKENGNYRISDHDKYEEFCTDSDHIKTKKKKGTKKTTNKPTYFDEDDHCESGLLTDEA